MRAAREHASNLGILGVTVLTSLADTGFDLLTFANNHTFDQRPAGLLETLEQIRAAGMASVGSGPTCAEARAPVIREVDGIDEWDNQDPAVEVWMREAAYALYFVYSDGSHGIHNPAYAQSLLDYRLRRERLGGGTGQPWELLAGAGPKIPLGRSDLASGDGIIYHADLQPGSPAI